MHVFLSNLTPVLPCVLSPVVVSPSSFSRRRGWCPSVRCVDLSTPPSHHLPNDNKKPSPLLPSLHLPCSSACHYTSVQQHVPQSIWNLNYPSPPWTGCSGSPSLCCGDTRPLLCFSPALFLYVTSLFMANLEIGFFFISLHCCPFFSDAKSKVRGSLRRWLWFWSPLSHCPGCSCEMLKTFLFPLCQTSFSTLIANLSSCAFSWLDANAAQLADVDLDGTQAVVVWRIMTPRVFIPKVRVCVVWANGRSGLSSGTSSVIPLDDNDAAKVFAISFFLAQNPPYYRVDSHQQLTHRGNYQNLSFQNDPENKKDVGAGHHFLRFYPGSFHVFLVVF